MPVRGVIKYNGTIIADFGGDESLKTLTTSGKMMNGNITVELKEGLPSGYTQLEYIKQGATDTCYIATGWYHAANTCVYAEAAFANTTTKYNWLFGNWSQLCFGPMSGDCIVGTGKQGIQPVGVFGTLATNTKYAIEVGNGKVAINGTSTTISSDIENATGLSFFICAADEGAYPSSTTPYWHPKGVETIYRMHVYNGTFQDWDNSTTVFDFYPAKRNSDGVAGLYDMVNYQFYPSTGSTAFIAGPEIN